MAETKKSRRGVRSSTAAKVYAFAGWYENPPVFKFVSPGGGLPYVYRDYNEARAAHSAGAAHHSHLVEVDLHNPVNAWAHHLDSDVLQDATIPSAELQRLQEALLQKYGRHTPQGRPVRQLKWNFQDMLDASVDAVAQLGDLCRSEHGSAADERAYTDLKRAVEVAEKRPESKAVQSDLHYCAMAAVVQLGDLHRAGSATEDDESAYTCLKQACSDYESENGRRDR